MTDEPIKTAILFPWTPDVDGNQLVETSASPEVPMRLEYVELLDGWQIVGLDIGALTYRVLSPDLRKLDLPPVQSTIRVTLRARNTSPEKQRFPGAKIVGVAIR